MLRIISKMEDDGTIFYYPQRKIFGVWLTIRNAYDNKFKFYHLWEATQYLDNLVKSRRYGIKVHVYKTPKY